MQPPYSEREKAILGELSKVSDILAEALGYPYDKDYGWVTGDHTAVSLAMEVKRKVGHSDYTGRHRRSDDRGDAAEAADS